jgi:hypothetical protein
MTESCALAPLEVGAAGGTRLRVARRPLGQGSYNAIYRTSLPKWALRTSLDGIRQQAEGEVRKEHALMAIFSREGVHPRAAGISYEPLRRPRSLSLVELEAPLAKFLDEREADDRSVDALAASLWRRLCAMADAGLCLMDIKPDNVLYDPAHLNCHLIDLADSVFMDAALLALLAKAGATPEQACARARGVSLATMALLFYLHLEKDDAKFSTPRQRRFMAFFAAALRRSRLPLPSLLQGLDPSRGRDCFACLLGSTVDHYFLDKRGDLRAAMAWFWRGRARQLTLEPSRASVTVAGRLYEAETAGCGPRRLGFHGIGQNAPCPLLGRGATLPFPVYFVQPDGKVGVVPARETTAKLVAAPPLELLATHCAEEQPPQR